MASRVIVTTDGYNFDIEIANEIGLYCSIEDKHLTIIDINNANKIIYVGEIKYIENRDY